VIKVFDKNGYNVKFVIDPEQVNCAYRDGMNMCVFHMHNGMEIRKKFKEEVVVSMMLKAICDNENADLKD